MSPKMSKYYLAIRNLQIFRKGHLLYFVLQSINWNQSLIALSAVGVELGDILLGTKRIVKSRSFTSTSHSF